jgi:uncharacterized RDD family membrane protein YckC
MPDNLSILSQPSTPPEPNNPYAPPTVSDLEPGAVLEPTQELEYVGFWRRAGARILDTGVHLALGLVAGVVVGIMTGVVAALRGVPFETLWPQVQPVNWMSWSSGILGSMLYLVVSTAGHGSSLGKLLLGIVVLEETGRPCTGLQAWKREILYFIDALFFGLIAYQQMSKSQYQQRLGDEWADTVVVHRRSAPKRSLRSGLQFAGVFFFAAFADVLVISLPFAIQLART